MLCDIIIRYLRQYTNFKTWSLMDKNQVWLSRGALPQLRMPLEASVEVWAKSICTQQNLSQIAHSQPWQLVYWRKSWQRKISTFYTQQTALLPYKGTTQGRCGEGGGRIFIECIKMTTWYRWGSAEDHLAKQFKSNSWFEWLGQRRQRRGVHPDLPA